MGTILFWAAVIGFGAAFPRAASTFAKLITFGFILPFMTVAMGSLSWGILTLLNVQIEWVTCVAVFGLPFALTLVYWILTD